MWAAAGRAFPNRSDGPQALVAAWEVKMVEAAGIEPASDRLKYLELLMFLS